MYTIPSYLPSLFISAGLLCAVIHVLKNINSKLAKDKSSDWSELRAKIIRELNKDQ